MLAFILVVVGFFIFGFISLGLYLTYSTPKVDERYVAMNKALAKIPYTKKFVSALDKNIITFNEDDNAIHLIKREEENQFNVDRINYHDILQVDIIQDEESITQTVRSSQIAGTIIGGVVLGGVGAAIGGLSGKKKHVSTVRNIGLQFIVNDTSNPIRKIHLYEFYRAIKTDEEQYKQSYNTVFEWFKLVEILIHQADKEDKLSQAQ